jgi:hypothetical protein
MIPNVARREHRGFPHVLPARPASKGMITMNRTRGIGIGGLACTMLTLSGVLPTASSASDGAGRPVIGNTVALQRVAEGRFGLDDTQPRPPPDRRPGRRSDVLPRDIALSDEE